MSTRHLILILGDKEQKVKVKEEIIYQQTITPGSDPYSCQNPSRGDECSSCPSENQQIDPGSI